jgi:biotin transport system substrate-specific component
MNAFALQNFRDARLRYFLWRISASPYKMIFASALFACATGILAGISIHLPFTPVPLTGQTLAVLAGGILLGRWGALSQFIYIALGICGVSWFADSLSGAVLFGPTMGYLAAFVAVPYLMGAMLDHKPGSTFSLRRILVVFFADLMILFSGTAYLALWIFVVKDQVPSLTDALLMGFLPFLPGEIVKIAMAFFISGAVMPNSYETRLNT